MRRSGESIEVRCRAGVPVRFRRPEVGPAGAAGARTGAAGHGEGAGGRRPRGPRWYAVRAVLGFWVESGAWWRSSAARAALALDAHEFGGLDAAEVGTRQTGDRVVWRVEARPEVRREAEVGVYELVRSGDGRWSLARTAD